MANFPKAYPAIGRSQGLAGATGLTGATGNGAVFTSVDSLSGAPRSVSDWGPILNTAIAAGVKAFAFGPFDYNFSTPINARDVEGMVWTGCGKPDYIVVTGTTRLIFTGTTGRAGLLGGTFAIDLSASSHTSDQGGHMIRDMAIMYSSNSYTGHLVDTTNSWQVTFSHCFFGSTNASTVSARAAISAGNVDGLYVHNCSAPAMFSGAFIEGRPTWSGFSNCARLTFCQVSGPVVINPGIDYVVEHLVLEPPLPAGAAAFTQDHAYASGDTQIGLTLRDCDYWDFTLGSGRIVEATANTWIFEAWGCKEHFTPGNLQHAYDLQCNGTVTIVGGVAGSLINVGDATITVQKKDVVNIVGLDDVSNNAGGILAGHLTPHQTVNITAGNPPTFLAQTGQSTTVHHERAHRLDQPAVVAHTGVTNHTFTVLGSDMTGYLGIRNTGGGVGPTGLLADVTLAHAPAGPGAGAGINTSTQFPVILLSVFQADDSGNWFVTSSPATTWTCQPYAYAQSLRIGGSQATFSIGVNVGIPAGATIGIAYRVVHL